MINRYCVQFLLNIRLKRLLDAPYWPVLRPGAWSLEKTLQASVGMFAIAVWDKQEQVLTLACDRMGEKPLYWGWCEDVLLFGSELKGLKVHPAFNSEIDRNALTSLLRHCYIPAP
jgi:asparagine synthase (glutamine-hydrolysing)